MDQPHPAAGAPQASEYDYLRLALQAAGIGTWNLDLIHQTVQWDERCRELYGFSRDSDVSYDQVLRFMHPDDAPQVAAAVSRALDPAAGGTYEITFRTLGADDGRLRWLLCKGQAYFNADKQPFRFSGTAQDVTEHVLLQEKAAAADRLATLALESSEAGWFHATLPDGACRYSPTFALVMTGNPQARLDWEGLKRHLHPDDRPQRDRMMDEARETGRLDYAARVIWEDGSIHWIRAKGRFTHDAQGRPQELHVTARDIGSEMETMHQLAESEARYRSLIASAPVAIGVFLGRDLIIENPNQTFIDIVGKGPDITGRPLREVMPELASEGQPFLKNLDDVFTTGITFRANGALVKIVQDGVLTHRYYDFTYSPLFDARGEVYAILDIAIDVTDRVEAAARVAESEARFRTVVEQSPMAIGLLKGPQLEVEMGNDLVFDIWGKGRSIIGLPIREALPEIEGQPFFDLLQQVYDTGEPYYGSGIRATISRAGALRDYWLDFVYAPVRDAEGSINGILVLAIDVTAQMESRLALAESERKFRALVAQAPVATCLFTGPDFVFEIANDIMIGYLGKGTAILGKPLLQALPELEGQPFPDILRHVYATGETYRDDGAFSQIVVDGQLQDFYFDFTYKPLFTASGEVYAIMEMAVDVTERVATRKRLEKSEEYARNIIDRSPVAKMVFLGDNLVLETVNAKMLDMLGMDASVLGHPFAEAMPELAATGIQAILHQVYASGEAVNQTEEKYSFTRNGQPHTGYYDMVFLPLRDSEGVVYGIIHSVIDMTDKVMARTQILEAEATLNTAVEVAELGLWHYEPGERLVHYSERLREWFGYGPSAPLEDCFAAVQPAEKARIRKSLEQALQLDFGGNFDEEYTAVNRSSGRARIVHIKGHTLFGTDGRPQKIIGIGQDVTQQRQLQATLEREVQERTEELASTNEELAATNEELAETNNQLVHSNEELTQYAYVASHDLQEPLRKIRMFSDMLNGKQELPAESQVLVNKISRSAERMTLLIRDLLEFSRLLKSDSLMQPVALSEVMADVKHDFELMISDKGATVSIGALPVIEAVRLQMNQLFYNLLGNALKFTKPGTPPAIRIDARPISTGEAAEHVQRALPGSQYYCISIADNGIGFETKYYEQIFEVFKRLHGREIYPGSGIGLALCRRIVANHGGALYVRSEVDKGTTFFIILPDRNHEYQSTIPDTTA